MKPELSVVGIDLVKNIFHLVGMDERGKIILRKRLASIGKSNGLFHRLRAPTLSPTLHHRVPPPGARAPARQPGPGRPSASSPRRAAS
jgi:hypothetical protein